VTKTPCIQAKSPFGTLALGALLLAALVGCAGTAKKKDADEAKKPAGPPASAFEKIYAQVEVASQVRPRSAVCAELPQNPDPQLDGFKNALCIDDEQARFSAFHKLVTKAPAEPGGHLGECAIYLQWKMADQAAAPCDQAEKALGPTALFSALRGQLALNKSQLAQAKKHFDAGMKADPKSPLIRIGLAQLHEKNGDKKSATDQWAAALTHWPQCALCANERARLVESENGLEAALPHWEKALALSPGNTDLLTRYAAAQAGRDDAKSLEAYLAAIQAGRGDLSTRLAAAAVAERLGRLDQAADLVAKGLETEKDDPEAWRRLGALHAARKDDAGRRQSAEEVLRLLPDDAAAHWTLFQLDRQTEKFVDALAHADVIKSQLKAKPDALDAATGQAAGAAFGELAKTLALSDPPLSGNANRVVRNAQRISDRVYQERLKAEPKLRGRIHLVVRTDASGRVEEVEEVTNTLGDPFVTGCLVGNLKAATISGGARNYDVELDFK
jgi:Tfp pilus assembly protein PilF